MSYIVYNKEEKKVEFKKFKVTATRVEDGSTFTQYAFEGELTDMVSKLMENNFSVTKVEELSYTDAEKKRMDVVSEIIEANPSAKWLGNVDALELFITTGYVDPTSELDELKAKRNDWDAKSYFTSKVKRYITNRRKEIEYGSIEYKGKQIDISKESSMKVASLYNSKKILGDEEMIAFKTLDGSFINLDMEELGDLLREIQKVINACFRAEMKASEWIKGLSLGQLYLYYKEESKTVEVFNELYSKCKEERK